MTIWQFMDEHWLVSLLVLGMILASIPKVSISFIRILGGPMPFLSEVEGASDGTTRAGAHREPREDGCEHDRRGVRCPGIPAGRMKQHVEHFETCPHDGRCGCWAAKIHAICCDCDFCAEKDRARLAAEPGKAGS